MVKKGAAKQAPAMTTFAVSHEPYDLPLYREVFFVIFSGNGRSAPIIAVEALPALTG